MAIKLQNKPNTDAPGGDYPYGNIRDNNGSGNGTPVNKLVYADFHQFFAKLLDASGITVNNLAENATNGFQYFEALQKLYQDADLFKADKVAPTWIDIVLTNGWLAAVPETPQYCIDQFGKVHFRGILNGTGASGFSVFADIPSPIAHTIDRTIIALRFTGSTFESTGLNARASDGKWRALSNISNNAFYLDGVSYWP